MRAVSTYFCGWSTRESSRLFGFVLASITGFLLGFMLFEWKFAGQLLWPLVIAFQALPKVALAPVLVIWFGTGQNAKIILVVIVSFFPVFINTMVGLESLHRNEEEMLHSFGANRWQVFLRIVLPLARPALATLAHPANISIMTNDS